ncbi:MAG TPA: hypothetical protein PLF50_05115 [Candidatus Cloacimonadota bacterium]|nr:hypothetical protein [Candidatus Cloacimonadota bacterium]
METTTLQLHDKVQKLIEQYTEDKKRLSELELSLTEKEKENKALKEEIAKLQQELQHADSKQTEEINNLKKRNQELEKLLDQIEGFALELDTQIDRILPKLGKPVS